MNLAVNYSLEAAELIRAGAMEVDLFKGPEWPELVGPAQAVRPMYVHFAFRAGPGEPRGLDWALVDEMLSRTATRHVNIHLLPAPGSLPAELTKAAETLLASVRMLTQRLGPERVAVENMPYWGGLDDDVPRPAVEPEVIQRIVQDSGCGLVLDLAHARLAARGLGRDEREYVAALPTERLCEMHVAGLGVLDGRLRDHQAMQADDWALLEEALANIRTGRWAEPWVVTFEYGGIRLPAPWPCEASVLAEQVPRLAALVHATT